MVYGTSPGETKIVEKRVKNHTVPICNIYQAMQKYNECLVVHGLCNFWLKDTLNWEANLTFILHSMKIETK